MSYPATLDTLTVPSGSATLGGSTPTHRQVHTGLATAIMAVQAVLGVNPQGASATVVARLNAMATANANASNLTTGTLADARLSANVPVMTGGVLPAVSGANLTALNADSLASGTIPNARLSGDVLVMTGGVIPPSNGANITNLSAGNVSTGTLADARLSANVPVMTAGVLPAVSGANLTALNGSQITTGTVPAARIDATLARIDAANAWSVKQTFSVGSATEASLNVPHGAAPTTPANGDIWSTTAGVFARINGATRTLASLESGASFTSSLRTTSTSGIGYTTGAGGTVTQATSKATGVTLSKACGTITLHAASLAAATSVSFVLTNTAIAATDLVVAAHDSVGTLGGYSVIVTPAAGSATVTVRNNTAGALAEAIVIRFAVIKAVTA